MRPRNFKPLRRTLISMFVLFVLFVAAGIGYTWYMGQKPAIASAIEAPVEVQGPSLFKPSARGNNTAVGASTQSIDSPVLPGSNSTIVVRTAPAAACTITITYNKIVSKDSSLVDKVADEYGMVSWSWVVGPSTPIGKWPVKVLCTVDVNSAMTIGYLEVVNKLY